MSKKVLYALVIIALLVIVLIVNRGRVEIDLVLGVIKPVKSLAFLVFTGIGVAIGVLLK